MRKRPPKSY